MENFNPITVNDNLPEFISVISGTVCARIRIADIEVLEQEGRRLHVILADREYTFYGNIATLLPVLAGRSFYRSIRGLVINFDHVRDISGNAITFHSGQCVTMGKNSVTRTRAAYKRYLRRYPPYNHPEGETAAIHPDESVYSGMQAAEPQSTYAALRINEAR